MFTNRFAVTLYTISSMSIMNTQCGSATLFTISFFFIMSTKCFPSTVSAPVNYSVVTAHTATLTLLTFCSFSVMFTDCFTVTLCTLWFISAMFTDWFTFAISALRFYLVMFTLVSLALFFSFFPTRFARFIVYIFLSCFKLIYCLYNITIYYTFGFPYLSRLLYVLKWYFIFNQCIYIF